MATTNNIGLYCFDTGNEDAKTSLEALFGAGNSNMKKIDDAIGELRKKSFIVNTEAELNALLTEENLGKTVSFNGALYLITEGGGSSNAPIAVGDTIDKLYFNTSVTPDLSGITYDQNDGSALLIETSLGSVIYQNLGVSSGGEVPDTAWVLYMASGGTPTSFIYSSIEIAEYGLVVGWQNLTDGAYSFGESATVTVVQEQDLWSSYISKEPFTGGGGIIAKPVGAEGGSGLPSFAPEDAGKFLRVDSNGNIVAEAIAYAEGESF